MNDPFPHDLLLPILDDGRCQALYSFVMAHQDTRKPSEKKERPLLEFLLGTSLVWIVIVTVSVQLLHRHDKE